MSGLSCRCSPPPVAMAVTAESGKRGRPRFKVSRQGRERQLVRSRGCERREEGVFLCSFLLRDSGASASSVMAVLASASYVSLAASGGLR